MLLNSVIMLFISLLFSMETSRRYYFQRNYIYMAVLLDYSFKIIYSIFKVTNNLHNIVEPQYCQIVKSDSNCLLMIQIKSKCHLFRNIILSAFSSPTFHIMSFLSILFSSHSYAINIAMFWFIFFPALNNIQDAFL